MRLKMQSAMRHRFVCGRQVGPVRTTKREAIDDAVAAGVAEYCPQYGRVFLHVPARIDSVDVD